MALSWLEEKYDLCLHRKVAGGEKWSLHNSLLQENSSGTQWGVGLFGVTDGQMPLSHCEFHSESWRLHWTNDAVQTWSKSSESTNPNGKSPNEGEDWEKYGPHFRGFCAVACRESLFKTDHAIKKARGSRSEVMFSGSNHNLYFQINVFTSIWEEEGLGK